MKGGKDEDKIMGPMFPRLHVNDTGKGGPRAPPRNKMALYEQLSVPSQRFNSGSQPPTNNSSLAPSASLSQGAARERTVFSPFHIPPLTPADSADNLHSHSSEGKSQKTRIQGSGQKSMKTANHQTSNSSMHFPPAGGSFHQLDITNSKNLHVNKLGNEDDFRVPTYVNSGSMSCLNKDQKNLNREKLTPLSPSRPGRSATTPADSVLKVAPSTCSSSTHHHNVRDRHLNRPNTTDLRSREHSRDHSEENLLESVTSKDCAGNTASQPMAREMIAETLNHAYASPVPEQNSPVDDLEMLDDTSAHLRQEYRAKFQENAAHSDGILAKPMELMKKGSTLWLRNESNFRPCLRNDHGSPNESCQDKENGLLQVEDVDRNDDVSETSMVDSITVLDISPDDVVGVIGQKQFWKARRAIVNQQRLFAVQVFELHRLIKVQRLIAGSPHLLLDSTPYLNKSSLKIPVKKLSSEYGLKSSQQIVKQKTEPQKPTQSTDCAGENAVQNPPPGSDAVNKGHANHHSDYSPYTGNPAPAPVTYDNNAGWCYHPPPGNQWLVPVMSPSEGLVYKPYAGPCPPTAGFMAPIYGGCGPMGVSPVGGEFPGAAYGIPPSHPQGTGFLSGAAPLAQTYFSPYGMPVMNPLIPAPAVEQVNPLAGVQSHGQPVQLSRGEANFNMHSRNSCNMSNQKSEAISQLLKFQASKESEVQGSTASSPCEKAQEAGTGNVSEGRDALSLFPMGPVQGPARPPNTYSTELQSTRVIKVVPHNPRSANESAARIFQSIQQERQQNDSV